MSLQLPIFEPPSDWEPPNLASLPSWAGCKRVGLDIETRDYWKGCESNGIKEHECIKKLGPGVRSGGYIVGVSFALEDGDSYYLPIRHFGGGNVDMDVALQYLRDQARSFDGTIVLANASYDLDFLEEVGVTFPKVKWVRDVQVADPLIDEHHFQYNLNAVAERWGEPPKSEAAMVAAAGAHGIKKKSVKGMLWKIHSKYVGVYAEDDATLPLRIIRKQEEEIDKQDLWQVYNLESRVTRTLVNMRRRGVKIDLDHLERVEKWSIDEEQKALSAIYEHTGVRIKLGDVWVKGPLSSLLSSIGINMPKTATGQDQIDKELLTKSNHPVTSLILRARKVNKLRTTFCNSIRIRLVGDRIHCSFNQLRATKDDGSPKGVRYGRLSSENPCLQAQPSRDDFAAFWRQIYVPDEGHLWLCADISQHEPRVITHFGDEVHDRYLKSRNNKLRWSVTAARMAEKWREDPNIDNYDFLSQVIYGSTDRKKYRDNIKRVYLGLCYGMGGGKLANALGMPTEIKHSTKYGAYLGAGPEAQEIIDQFNNRVPFLRRLSWMCQEVAEKRGYVRTMLGRKCRFPVGHDGVYDFTHKAFSRVVQGGCADQIKLAMCDVDDAGIKVQLQVHDELDASVISPEEASRMIKIMQVGVPLKVPLKIDRKLGKSWGEVKVV